MLNPFRLRRRHAQETTKDAHPSILGQASPHCRAHLLPGHRQGTSSRTSLLMGLIYYTRHLQLIDAVSSRVPAHAEGTGIDILGWMSRAALELIGQAGIGYSFDPLTEDVPDAYADAVKNFACVSLYCLCSKDSAEVMFVYACIGRLRPPLRCYSSGS